MKINNNVSLQTAKNSKNDEFYTTYEEIERELKHYKKYFKGKVVLCNCDDPFESNFCKFFINHFEEWGLRKLICTSYKNSPIAESELQVYLPRNKRKKGSVLIITDILDSDIKNKDIKDIIMTSNFKKLDGDGDFSSKECVEYLKEADIVVTNPPFSLFRQFVSLLIEYKKKFLVIGNMNAITYKEIFPLVKDNQAWLGYHNGEMAFKVPSYSKPRKTRFWIDESGQKWRSLGNAMWFTNIDVSYRHKLLVLKKEYNPIIHRSFDNYDAINVPKVSEIPFNYDGIMAVPLTILTKYNPEQFEIVGEANHGSDNPYDLFMPIIDRKEIFKRILIRKKNS